LDFSNRVRDLLPTWDQTNVGEEDRPKPNCVVALLKAIFPGRYDCARRDSIDADAVVGTQ